MSADPDDPDEPPLTHPLPDELAGLTDAEVARLAAAIWARVVGTDAGDEAAGA